MEKRYYLLRNTIDPKQTGISDNDQIAELNIDYDQKVFDKYQMMDRRDFEKNLPPLKNFVLAKGAKITNIISSRFIQIVNGLLVDKKVEKIFDNVSISNFKKMDARLFKEQESLDYKFFYILESPSIINFKKSEFILTDILGLSKEGDIQFRTADEFYNKCKEIGANRIEYRHVVLNRDFDMFRLPWESYLCISENLKNILERERITGIEIMDSKMDFSLDLQK